MDFDYTIVRSARKTLGLQVCRDGKVIVRAPLSADDDYIAKSVDKHREWIEQNIQFNVEDSFIKEVKK